ncbi:hypothetical protein KDJ56_00990 [Brevibacillus composti]|uniref:Type II secretion system protein GspF domain-containing protein n=1 Tax=Brevibacillus composti TaxID=2796470 RepID=A0A7T5EL80_9BACL|nr:hypothetical protein [Brevibacillus composti]QQE74615.1 hypothetical protein JD108_00990 [Brevibacillus composti]QUO41698.1 hypothetical protein KDJ56_00990 [Brevibacillus composti]
MPVVYLYATLTLGALFVFIGCFALGKHWAGLGRRPKLFVTLPWKEFWTKTVNASEDPAWERLLERAGRPFGWGKPEWVFAQCVCGTAVCLLMLFASMFNRSDSFPLLTLLIASTLSFFLPYIGLKMWANYREEVLSTDIARFINRYVNLLENQVPVYAAMVKAARPTRLLKEYVPSLSEWNEDPDKSLENFKRKLGVDDAIMLVSSMRTVESLSGGQVALTMQRLEWAVDHRRMFRHRKKIKSLGIGYSIIVYPAFYMGLLVAMYPWYKLLTEILDKYLT